MSKQRLSGALADAARAECVALTSRGECLMRSSGRCNLEVGKRCSHFARVILPKHQELRSEYNRLPKRGPFDTPESVSGRKARQ